MLKLIRDMATSKKFVAAVAGVIVGFAGRLGFDLPMEEVETLLYPILAYIVGQGAADLGKHMNTGK